MPLPVVSPALDSSTHCCIAKCQPLVTQRQHSEHGPSRPCWPNPGVCVTLEPRRTAGTPILSLGYVGLVIVPSSGSGGGFGTLADVMELFSYEQAALAAWVHFLAFDLIVGAWICRTARSEKISFWLVAPCLPLTFLFGPAGFLVFSVARGISRPKAAWAPETARKGMSHADR